MYPEDTNISKHAMFFNKNDSLLVAYKTWYCCISEDYDFWGGIFSQKINFCTLSGLYIFKLQDIYEIVYFMNPQDIYKILENPKSYQIVNFFYQKF